MDTAAAAAVAAPAAASMQQHSETLTGERATEESTSLTSTTDDFGDSTSDTATLLKEAGDQLAKLSERCKQHVTTENESLQHFNNITPIEEVSEHRSPKLMSFVEDSEVADELEKPSKLDYPTVSQMNIFPKRDEDFCNDDFSEHQSIPYGQDRILNETNSLALSSEHFIRETRARRYNHTSKHKNVYLEDTYTRRRHSNTTLNNVENHLEDDNEKNKNQLVTSFENVTDKYSNKKSSKTNGKRQHYCHPIDDHDVCEPKHFYFAFKVHNFLGKINHTDIQRTSTNQILNDVQPTLCPNKYGSSIERHHSDFISQDNLNDSLKHQCLLPDTVFNGILDRPSSIWDISGTNDSHLLSNMMGQPNKSRKGKHHQLENYWSSPVGSLLSVAIKNNLLKSLTTENRAMTTLFNLQKLYRQKNKMEQDRSTTVNGSTPSDVNFIKPLPFPLQASIPDTHLSIDSLINNVCPSLDCHQETSFEVSKQSDNPCLLEQTHTLNESSCIVNDQTLVMMRRSSLISNASKLSSSTTVPQACSEESVESELSSDDYDKFLLTEVKQPHSVVTDNTISNHLDILSSESLFDLNVSPPVPMNDRSSYYQKKKQSIEVLDICSHLEENEMIEFLTILEAPDPYNHVYRQTKLLLDKRSSSNGDIKKEFIVKEKYHLLAQSLKLKRAGYWILFNITDIKEITPEEPASVNNLLKNQHMPYQLVTVCLSGKKLNIIKNHSLPLRSLYSNRSNLLNKKDWSVFSKLKQHQHQLNETVNLQQRCHQEQSHVLHHVIDPINDGNCHQTLKQEMDEDDLDILLRCLEEKKASNQQDAGGIQEHQKKNPTELHYNKLYSDTTKSDTHDLTNFSTTLLTNNYNRRAGRPKVNRAGCRCLLCNTLQTPQWRFMTLYLDNWMDLVCNACYMKFNGSRPHYFRLGKTPPALPELINIKKPERPTLEEYKLKGPCAFPHLMRRNDSKQFSILGKTLVTQETPLNHRPPSNHEHHHIEDTTETITEEFDIYHENGTQDKTIIGNNSQQSTHSLNQFETDTKDDQTIELNQESFRDKDILLRSTRLATKKRQLYTDQCFPGHSSKHIKTKFEENCQLLKANNSFNDICHEIKQDEKNLHTKDSQEEDETEMVLDNNTYCNNKNHLISQTIQIGKKKRKGDVQFSLPPLKKIDRHSDMLSRFPFLQNQIEVRKNSLLQSSQNYLSYYYKSQLSNYTIPNNVQSSLLFSHHTRDQQHATHPTFFTPLCPPVFPPWNSPLTAAAAVAYQTSLHRGTAAAEIAYHRTGSKFLKNSKSTPQPVQAWLQWLARRNTLYTTDTPVGHRGYSPIYNSHFKPWVHQQQRPAISISTPCAEDSTENTTPGMNLNGNKITKPQHEKTALVQMGAPVVQLGSPIS